MRRPGQSPPLRLPLFAPALLLLASQFINALIFTVPARAASPPPLRILTTLPAVHSWVASVAGTNAQTESLLPAGANPHQFQFRPRDLERISRADLIVSIGLGLEDWLERALRNNAGKASQPRVILSTGWESELIRDLPYLDPSDARHVHDHSHGDAPNPHVWLDPVFARHAVSNILSALVAAAPIHASTFRINAMQYLGELARLDRDFEATLARIPDRRIITFHDAFPYLARRYRLELAGVIEQVPSVSPSAKYLHRLTKVIREKKVRVLFTEPQSNPRLARQLARDLNVAVAELDTLETSPPAADAYIRTMRTNLGVLERELR